MAKGSLPSHLHTISYRRFDHKKALMPLKLMKILWQCIEKPCHNLFRLAENVVLVEHRICTNHPLYNNQKRIAMVVNFVTLTHSPCTNCRVLSEETSRDTEDLLNSTGAELFFANSHFLRSTLVTRCT